ncbi:MAG: Mor transcription activator family protein [Thermodesulfobacteriota bacterium]
MDIPAQQRWILDEDPAQLLVELPEPFHEACEGMSMRELVEFVARHEGQTVYFPSLEHMARGLRDARMRREFTGTNHRELSRRYGVSLTHVYRVLSEREAS